MSKGIQYLSNTSQQNVEIKLDILSSDEFKSELRTLKAVFSSSYGPTGRINFIQNKNGGHVVATSNSSQILKSITTVSSPLIQLLLKSFHGHSNQFHDGGIFVALLTIQLIESSLKSGLPRHIIIAVNELALSIILQNVECLSIKVDFSNVEQMLCIIRTILMSKPVIGLSMTETQTLAVTLLQGFLKCVPSEKGGSFVLDNLRIQTCEGPSTEKSCLTEGILLDLCCPEVKPIYANGNEIKIALFDCSLAGNVEDGWPSVGETELFNDLSLKIEDDVLKLMMRMVDDMIKHQVQLVACQKIIHPTLKHYITSHNLYFVERLSIFHIEAVKKLTGAKLISSCFARISEESYGSLKEIKLLTIQKRRFLNLISHPQTKPEISTFLLCAPDEHSLYELKLVCTGVLNSLKQLLMKPYVLPGGGCFETIVTGVLIEATKNNSNFPHGIFSKEQYSIGINSVASVFLQIALALDHDDFEHLVDTKTFHNWICRDNNLETLKRCLCGSVNKTQASEFYMMEELLHTLPKDINVHKALTWDVKEYRQLAFDVMSIKVNGIKTAFETANILLRVRHFVREFLDEG